MVVSKRCKICAALETDNIPISGEYFGKTIPILVNKICGVELDERKMNGILICQHCVIELVHTDVVIDKFRNSVQRLKKTEKQNKHKTPSKGTTKKLELINGETNKSTQKNSVDVNLEADTKLEAPKRVARRKSLFPDEKLSNITEVDTNSEIKKLSKAESTSVKKIKLDSKRKLDSEEDIADSSNIDITNSFQEVDDSSFKLEKRSKLIDDPDLNQTQVEEKDEKTTNTKIHNCVLCLKNFYQKSALRNHIDACHVGDRLKECPLCSTEFRSIQKYESHVFNEKCKKAVHPCQYPNCQKRFKTVHKMELHMQEKHSSQKDSETD